MVEEAQQWTPAWMREVLRLPPLADLGEGTFDDKVGELLARLIAPTQSGFTYVYKVGERFQAKPYIKPKTQRNLGYYDDAIDAAEQILRLAYEKRGLPPSPKKDRNKRGEGARPRPKRQKAAPQASQATPLAELQSQPPTPATFAAMGVYTAPFFEGEAPGAPTVVASLFSHM